MSQDLEGERAAEQCSKIRYLMIAVAKPEGRRAPRVSFSGEVPQVRGSPIAQLPLDSKRVRVVDVAPDLLALCEDVGMRLPSVREAAWTQARVIAEAMLAGAVQPYVGAHNLWFLWEPCGEPPELVDALALSDEWEQTAPGSRTF